MRGERNDVSHGSLVARQRNGDEFVIGSDETRDAATIAHVDAHDIVLYNRYADGCRTAIGLRVNDSNGAHLVNPSRKLLVMEFAIARFQTLG